MTSIDWRTTELTDNVLYGDVWERPQLSKRDRSLVTVAALIAMNRPDQLRSHLVKARENGVKQEELIETTAKEGVPVKGAVILCSGGAFAFRNNRGEGEPVARALSQLGYQCFVVNYRVRPYTQQEGALDLARAVRYVRSRAQNYGIRGTKIAVAGFSAGGILCGELLLNFKGKVCGTALDSRYVPDELDKVSADASAIGHIYSFYGRLSVASRDVELFRRSNLPPAYFCYGTQDPFVNDWTVKRSCSDVQVKGVAITAAGWTDF